MEAALLVLASTALIIILSIVWTRNSSRSSKQSNQGVSYQSDDPEEPLPCGARAQNQVNQETTQHDCELNSGAGLIVPPSVVSNEEEVPILRIPGSPHLPEHFVFLDLETTGLSPELDEIIEIGAIRFSLDQTEHATFSTLIKPQQRVPKRITEITGITQGMVNEHGVPLAEALSLFTNFIGDLPLVTFNADFDMAFLLNAAKLQSLVIENRYACALKLARRAWPGLSSYRLADLARLGKLDDEDTHRALGDCKRGLIIFASAVREIGEAIRWSHRQRDWHEYVKYHAARNPNRAFVLETRPFEISDLNQAVTRYNEAMTRMYEYEKLIGSRTGDDHILDRLTLCLWKLGRYRELMECVDYFEGRFPEAESTLMVGIRRRRERAARKLSPMDRNIN